MGDHIIQYALVLWSPILWDKKSSRRNSDDSVQLPDKPSQKVRFLNRLLFSIRMGKAHGFFDCTASKEEIEALMPKIRDCAQAPSPLELSVMEGIGHLQSDAKLMTFVQQAKIAGRRYVIEATYPDKTNEETAEELGVVLSQLYESQLYKKGEPFFGDIVYEAQGMYFFQE